MHTPGSAAHGGPLVHRGSEDRERWGGSSVATSIGPQTRGPVSGKALRERILSGSLGIFFTYRNVRLTGVVAALSSMGRGPFPARQRGLLNPARPLTLLLAGECPLYARAIVILFWPAHGWRGNAALPVVSRLSLQSGACEHSSPFLAPKT